MVALPVCSILSRSGAESTVDQAAFDAVFSDYKLALLAISRAVRCCISGDD